MSECRKQRYRFESDAKLAMEITAKKAARKGKPVPKRVYFCRHCGGWHITARKRNWEPWKKGQARSAE